MRKKYYAVLLGLAVTAALTGCGSDKKETETEFSTAAPEEIAEEDVIVDDAGTEEMPEAVLEPITPSDYLISDASDYVTPGSYEGLAVTQYTYEITDDMLQEMIDSDLQMNSTETEVERASAANDVIYVDMTYAVQDGGQPTSESTYFYLGMEEFGTEFDKELTGLSAGDTKKFSIAFDDTAIMEEWMDATVDFEITVTSVCEVSTPEYNDSYVKEYYGYDTIADYEAATREYITAEYDDISYSDTIDLLFDTAVEQSTFTGYPQELYDTCRDEVFSFYLDYTDGSDPTEVYELFGLSEEDIESEILSLVNRRLFVSKMCADKNIQVTGEEYAAYVAETSEYYGYDNAVSFEQDYGRTSLVWTLYESKAGEILYDAAVITKEPFEEEYIEGVEILEEDTEAGAEDDIAADEEAETEV